MDEETNSVYEPKGKNNKRQTLTADKIWRDYENALSYQRMMGFSEKYPEYEKFKNGDQWPAATERTRALPRPVFNIIRMFVSNKKSNVLSQNVKLIFSPCEVYDDENSIAAIEGAEDYTDFAANLWAELKQDTLNDYMVDDAVTFGTGILHYYWDNTVTGGEQTPYIGALRGEAIDPLNIFFANPQQTDVQKQEWIIVAGREDVIKLRKEAEANGLPSKDIELIQGDKSTEATGYDAARKEQQGNEKTWVLTRYYRDSTGGVCVCRSTQNVIITPGKSITPNTLTEREERYYEALGEPINRHIIKRYPIAIFPWYTAKKCIFGLGEVEGLIPNQKAINFNMAMMLLSVQDNAWPKIVAKPGALKQQITNKPGEILTDYYTSGDGVKYMQPPNFNYMSINLVDKVFDLSRTTSGVTEVTTGESLGANMAASAIIALQNQARVPIDNIQKRFYRCLRDVGLIWEEFFKTYYNTPRSIAKEDVNGGIYSKRFVGENYSNVEFSLKVDISASSTYSESLALTYLDKMYDKGDITADMYIELAPSSVVPYREKLKQLRRQMIQQGTNNYTPVNTGEVQNMPINDMLNLGGYENEVPTLQYGGNNN